MFSLLLLISLDTLLLQQSDGQAPLQAGRVLDQGPSPIPSSPVQTRVRNSHPKPLDACVIFLVQFTHLLHEDNKRNSPRLFMLIIILKTHSDMLNRSV